MPENHTYHYDFSVIEKYLKNELSASEMHELERAALRDPFLADALDGYQLSDLHKSQTDLTDIKQKIAGDESKGQLIPFKRTGVRWWQIAALFILLAGLTTSIWKFSQPDPSSSIINASTHKIERTRDSLTPVPLISGKETQKSFVETDKKNSLIAQAAPPAPVRQNEQLTAELKETYTYKLQDAATITANTKKQLQEDSTMQIQLMKSSAATLRKRTEIGQALSGKVAGVQVTPASTSYVLKGKVVDFMQKPLSYATVQFTTSGVEKAIGTYSDGSFQISSKDSVMNATVSALGHQPVTLNLSAATNNLVALQQGASALNEVVVVGYGKERKTSFTGSVSKENVVRDTSSIRPPGGIDTYVLSIRQQWQTQQWDSTQLKGNIECILSFNANGYITKVSFTKTHSRLLKKRLTKLLKASPPWERTGTLSGADYKVVFSF